MKKLSAILLAALLIFSGAMAAYAVTLHDNEDCALDNVKLTVGGTTYVSEGEQSIRLDYGTAKFYFNAVANVVHDKRCDELDSGSSVVSVYYKINKGKFVKAATSSNPSGRGDISFDNVKIPTKGELEPGDNVTIEFRYDNSGRERDTLKTFYVDIQTHAEAEASRVVASSPSTPSAAQGGAVSSAAAAESNPNTGLTLAPAALAFPAALAAAFVTRRGRKKVG